MSSTGFLWCPSGVASYKKSLGTLTDTTITSNQLRTSNELLLNNMIRPRHTGVLHSAPVVYQISYFVYFSLVNKTLVYSFSRTWGHGTWFQQSNLNVITSYIAINPLRCIHSLHYIWLGNVRLGFVMLGWIRLRLDFLPFRFVSFTSLKKCYVSFHFIALRYVTPTAPTTIYRYSLISHERLTCRP